jgi:Tfp pilus assembly protein PilF
MSEDKIALYKSGLSKFTSQDFDGAVTDFKKALELDPNFGDVHQALAHAYEKLEDFNAAVTSCKRAVECNPDDFYAHTSLSIFYQRVGMIPEAEEEKAIAARLQPKG